MKMIKYLSNKRKTNYIEVIIFEVFNLYINMDYTIHIIWILC